MSQIYLFFNISKRFQYQELVQTTKRSNQIKLKHQFQQKLSYKTQRSQLIDLLKIIYRTLKNFSLICLVFLKKGQKENNRDSIQLKNSKSDCRYIIKLVIIKNLLKIQQKICETQSSKQKTCKDKNDSYSLILTLLSLKFFQFHQDNLQFLKGGSSRDIEKFKIYQFFVYQNFLKFCLFLVELIKFIRQKVFYIKEINDTIFQAKFNIQSTSS
ncbi:hypothetical protein TTHERM_000289579 (macronuclear) [Tetrahymena thermophila SB210]|uniref:Uncharacterized protein n=1 Tax=Tetrahymena thermophila (strain SB210) TaxID=312017 RepID=W7X8S2_TETTS|nr:hypothetical protein TTHERM_000289579 [Tetrahymena thermophila SB210]EWS73757.1 hypothetical protein TTHERM_000289579 [Tetrahymena thermophila SB210]|eukprot:XP_012653721.1 hypothetical protein TTHERM_000289579 [Tetrahymena thermophila SB210]